MKRQRTFNNPDTGQVVTIRKKIEKIQWLPIELVSHIFDSFKDNIKALYTLSGVNKLWRLGAQNILKAYVANSMPFFKKMRETELDENPFACLSEEIKGNKAITQVEEPRRPSLQIIPATIYTPDVDLIISALTGDVTLIDLDDMGGKVQQKYYYEYSQQYRDEIARSIPKELKKKLYALAVANDVDNKIDLNKIYTKVGRVDFEIELFKACVRNGNLDRLKSVECTPKNKKDAEKWYSEMCNLAASHQQFNILHHLFNEMTEKEYSVTLDFDKLIKPIVECEKIALMEKIWIILYLGSPKIAEDIFQHAVEKNKLSVLKYFLELDKIPVEMLAEIYSKKWGVSHEIKSLIAEYIIIEEQPDTEMQSNNAFLPGFDHLTDQNMAPQPPEPQQDSTWSFPSIWSLLGYK